jgi:hypothetical protein
MRQTDTPGNADRRRQPSLPLRAVRARAELDRSECRLPVDACPCGAPLWWSACSCFRRSVDQTNCQEADRHHRRLMAGGGCSGRRNRRHFADVQDPSLTDRYGAGSSVSRPSSVGQKRALLTVRFRRPDLQPAGEHCHPPSRPRVRLVERLNCTAQRPLATAQTGWRARRCGADASDERIERSQRPVAGPPPAKKAQVGALSPRAV